MNELFLVNPPTLWRSYFFLTVSSNFVQESSPISSLTTFPISLFHITVSVPQYVDGGKGSGFGLPRSRRIVVLSFSCFFRLPLVSGLWPSASKTTNVGICKPLATAIG